MRKRLRKKLQKRADAHRRRIAGEFLALMKPRTVIFSIGKFDALIAAHRAVSRASLDAVVDAEVSRADRAAESVLG